MNYINAARQKEKISGEVIKTISQLIANVELWYLHFVARVI